MTSDLASTSNLAPQPPGRTTIDRGRKRSEAVARGIVRDVLMRKLEPGSQLPSEAAMLKEYDVSRSSLREALRILEVNGFITIKSGPRGGPLLAKVDGSDFGKMATFYYHVTQATFGELVEARMFVEPLTTRLAATRGSDADMEELRRNVAEAEECSGDIMDQLRSVELSYQFHQLVARMAGNQVLALIGSSFQEIFTVYASDAVPPAGSTVHAHARMAARAHARIAEALLARDADRAESLMRDHLASSAEDLHRRYPTLRESAVGWL